MVTSNEVTCRNSSQVDENYGFLATELKQNFAESALKFASVGRKNPYEKKPDKGMPVLY